MGTGKVDSWRQIDEDECHHAEGVLELVGRRWAGSVLLALGRGAERFVDIIASVKGLSARMLAVRLRELEAAHLVDRVVVPTMPVTVRYRLTPQGRDLLAALQPIAIYAHRWESTAG